MWLNPYVAGPPVGGEQCFVGRTAILRRVLEVVRRPGDMAVVLFGQRRIGKTSILQALDRWLPEQGPYRPVVFDLQDKASLPLDRVLGELAACICMELGLEEPDLGPDPEGAFKDRFLPEALATLPAGGRVVLLFDEFDVLADPGTESAAQAFFPYLRALLDAKTPGLDLVFVIGRNLADLETRALSLFKVMPAVEVSVLDWDETRELVRISETQGSLTWSESALDAVWSLTRGHPLLTQQLCSALWERLHQDRPAEAPEAQGSDIDDALVERVLDGARNTLEWLWDGLGPPQRVVASAIAAAGARAIGAEEIEELLRESGIRVVYRELQKAPQLLREWDILEPAPGGYRFKVELLRRWVAERKPLDRVQEELDFVLPAAENVYLAAENLYQAGDLDQALPLLRQAVRLNPNHVRATELLADVLISLGERAEARQILERLYEFQPRAARSRLVLLLVEDAPRQVGEAERLATWEQVLDLDPNHRTAARERSHILERRGVRQEERGDLEAAMASFEAAGLDEQAARVLRVWQDRMEENGRSEVRRYLDRNALGAAREALERMERTLSPERCTDLRRELEQRTLVHDTYEAAMGALASGEEQTARRLLAEVVSLDPEYTEASRSFLEVVTQDTREGSREGPPPPPPSPALRPWWTLAAVALVVASVFLAVRYGPLVVPPEGTGMSVDQYERLRGRCSQDQSLGDCQVLWQRAGELERVIDKRAEPTQPGDDYGVMSQLCEDRSLLACVRTRQLDAKRWLPLDYRATLGSCDPAELGGCAPLIEGWAATLPAATRAETTLLAHAAACDRLDAGSCAALARSLAEGTRGPAEEDMITLAMDRLCLTEPTHTLCSGAASESADQRSPRIWVPQAADFGAGTMNLLQRRPEDGE